MCLLTAEFCDLQSRICEKIEREAHASVENRIADGVAAVTKAVGSWISSIPKIGSDKLLQTGERVEEWNEKRIQELLQPLIKIDSGGARPFIENIRAINTIYNKPFEILFNEDQLFIPMQCGDL